jgi:hypothetical protein
MKAVGAGVADGADNVLQVQQDLCASEPQGGGPAEDGAPKTVEPKNEKLVPKGGPKTGTESSPTF